MFLGKKVSSGVSQPNFVACVPKQESDGIIVLTDPYSRIKENGVLEEDHTFGVSSWYLEHG